MTDDMGHSIVWHPEAMAAGASETLRALRDRGLTVDAYLAGGTALALHFGHRISVDLDIFMPTPFEEEGLLAQLQNLPGFSLTAKAPSTIHAVIQGTKVSFLGYSYPMLFPVAPFQGVAVADARDIACMKVSAIASRGAKRDFIDLFIASERYGLQNILNWFSRKYEKIGYNRLHVIKSLTFFADAEKDPLPHLLVPLAWDEVKSYLRGQVPALL